MLGGVGYLQHATPFLKEALQGRHGKVFEKDGAHLGVLHENVSDLAAAGQELHQPFWMTLIQEAHKGGRTRGRGQPSFQMNGGSLRIRAIGNCLADPRGYAGQRCGLNAAYGFK